MSGPRSRRDVHLLTKKTRRAVLCPKCDLNPGWGWEAAAGYKRSRMNTDCAPLIPAGNGWETKGLCPYCLGNGLHPIPFSELT